MQVLLFKGYKVPDKRYKSFIDKLVRYGHSVKIQEQQYRSHDEQQVNIQGDLQDQQLCILGHSVGIIRGIVWCIDNHVTPAMYISLDGTCLDPQLINVATKPVELQQIYQQYINQGGAQHDIPVFAYMNQKRKPLPDQGWYKSTIYYSRDTHYPHEITSVTDSIVYRLNI